MTGLSKEASRAIAAKFPWKRYRTFVDIGCAEGGLAVELAGAHPHLRGLGFDLAPVETIFAGYVEDHGFSDRLTFHAGDMFAEPFPKADVVTLGHVVHNWGGEQKRELLRKAYDSVPDRGAILIFEALIDDDRRENTFGLLMSLNMLVMTPAGSDFTGSDCRGWLEEAGFRKTYVERLSGPDSMVVGIK
jgi:SAM-dependent methyltransferase